MPFRYSYAMQRVPTTRPFSLELCHVGSHADQYAGGHHRGRDPLRMLATAKRLAAPAQVVEPLQNCRGRIRRSAGPRNRGLVLRIGLLPHGAHR
ncbi:hypothetical protein D3C72_480660 [compost metagenome]